LWRIAPSPTLCFDGDAAGLKAAYRALDLALPLLKPGHSLKFALLPEGQDPDDLLRTEGPEAVKAVIAEARPLADILWGREAEKARIDTPDGRASFEVRLSSLVREIGDETVRKYYGEDFKARLARHLAPQGGPSLRGFGRGRARYMPAKPLIQARRGPRARPLPHDYSAPPSEGLRASPLAQRSTLHELERRERL
jgi:DNA primase